MFRIADGRESFYQWDLDRQIIVEDNSIVEVHFCNRTDDCSLVVEVVDGLANVPNILLQSSFDVRVFGYDGKATLHDKKFKVNARTKPADYTYKETEIKSYEYLENKIKEIEENGVSDEVIEKAVKDYLTEVEVVDEKAREDIEEIKNAGYATEGYVDNAIDNIPGVDLSKHALKSELPTKVSQLENDSKFITREEVPETDLSAYAKKSEIPTVPSKVSAFTNDAGYLTQHQDLSAYAKKSEIPDVSDFITSIPEEYITESELEAKGYLTSEDIPDDIDTSNFLTKTTVDDQYNWYVPTTNKNQVIQYDVPLEKTDTALDVVVGSKTLNKNSIALRDGLQLRVPETPTNNGHAASKKYVDDKVAAISQPDLTEYAKKTDIPDVSDYQTEAQVNALINQALGVIENGSY